MNLHRYKIQSALAALIMGGAFLGTGVSHAQPEADQQGAEVLTRGPVHEAFAGTISYDPEPGMLVDREPPVLIEEVPPEQRLEGDNVTWIPGYWAWDDDQNDFLWISGIWRNLPPGREWVPGYWAQSEARWQWTSGYWEDAETTEVSYLPEPPRSLETGPNVEATSNDQTWVPGNWVYREERYAWRPGTWSSARENWVWVPAYYRWTRRGYVYVDGYWDYPVVRRGVVFAPVRFQPAYVSRPDFSYSPLTVISLAVFTNHLFVRPSHNHYYFGDYYEPRYRDNGYHASYSYNRGRRGYDPFYAHDRWEHRNDRGWDRKREEYFEYRRDNRDARPPRTWMALNSRPQADRERYGYDVADRFDRVSNRKDGRQRFQAVDKKERERYISQRQEIRKFGRDREQLEIRGKNVPEGSDKDRSDSKKQKVNRSPVMAKKSDRSDKDGGPPARVQARASERKDNDGPANRGDNKNDKNKDANGKRDDQPKREGQPNRESEGKRDDQPKREGEAKREGEGKREGQPKREGDGKRDDQPKRGDQPKREGESKRDDQPKREGEYKRDDQGKQNGKPQPAVENRDKPGQRRDVKPEQDQKRKSDPAPQQKDKPKAAPKQDTPNRQGNPNPERKENKPQQAKPEQKRDVAPAQNRQANPERKANPTPKREATPEPKRQANPEQKRKASPEQPKKKAEASAAPARRTEEPKRQAAAQRQAERPAAKPQPTQVRQQKAQTASKGKGREADSQKKKKGAE